jgi:hypothetical protein
MTNQIIINQPTIDSMKNIVDMYMDQERTHLEESLDHDLSDMSDEKVYEMCKFFNINHIWLDLYNISLLTK